MVARYRNALVRVPLEADLVSQGAPRNLDVIWMKITRGSQTGGSRQGQIDPKIRTAILDSEIGFVTAALTAADHEGDHPIELDSHGNPELPDFLDRRAMRLNLAFGSEIATHCAMIQGQMPLSVGKDFRVVESQLPISPIAHPLRALSVGSRMRLDDLI
jgi:hypothetical protein